MDKGVEPAPKEPPLTLLVPVHVMSRAEKPENWGDVMVTRPTEVRYQIGNEATAALANVADFVKKGWAAIKDTPNANIGGEIKAGYKVPFARVFDVMEVRGLGMHEGVLLPPGFRGQCRPLRRGARGCAPPVSRQELRHSRLIVTRSRIAGKASGVRRASGLRPRGP